MRSLRFCAAIVAITTFFPGSTYAQFSEDFEFYTVGDVSGQGPWVDFGGTETADISTAQAFSGTQSLALSTATTGDDIGGLGSDVYVANLNGTPVTSGVWNLSYQLFVPASFDGQVQMYFSQGTMPDNFEEGTFIRANNNVGINPAINRLSFVAGQNGVTPARLLLDQWVEVKALIDLDNDTQELSYNGSVFHTSAWDIETPGGAIAIGGINFWVDSGLTPGTIYLDDFSFTSLTSSVLLGDVDVDGDVDCDDLDGYVGNIGAAATGALAALDIDGNGTLDASDADTHITTLVQTSNGSEGTFPGDLNCDGTVDVLGDAFILIGNLGNTVTSYSLGDINFDGTVDVLGDAFILIGNLGNTNEP